MTAPHATRQAAAATSPPPGRRTFGFRARQAWAVARYDFRRQRGARGAAWRLALVALPLVISGVTAIYHAMAADQAFIATLVTARGRRAPAAELLDLTALLRHFDLRVVILFAAAVVFGALYRSEITDRTLHYLFLTPTRREVVAVGKFVGGFLALGSAAVVVWLLCAVAALVPHGLGALVTTLLSVDGIRHVVGGAAVLLLGCLAYGALFMLAGLLFRSPVVVAAVVCLWEWLASFLPASFQHVTLIFWLDSLLPAPAADARALASAVEPAGVASALCVLLLASLACVSSCALLARRTELGQAAAE